MHGHLLVRFPVLICRSASRCHILWSLNPIRLASAVGSLRSPLPCSVSMFGISRVLRTSHIGTHLGHVLGAQCSPVASPALCTHCRSCPTRQPQQMPHPTLFILIPHWMPRSHQITPQMMAYDKLHWPLRITRSKVSLGVTHRCTLTAKHSGKCRPVNG